MFLKLFIYKSVNTYSLTGKGWQGLLPDTTRGGVKGYLHPNLKQLCTKYIECSFAVYSEKYSANRS